MKKLLTVLLLVFVAASAQHAITIDVEAGTITVVEETSQPAGYEGGGSHSLQARDDTGETLTETTFSPELIRPDGTAQLMEEATVVLATPPATQTIHLLRGDEELDSYTLAEECGNGYCAQGEVCRADCLEAAPEVFQQAQIGVEVDSRRGWTGWLIVIACVVLIIALLLVLRHTSRGPPPVETGNYVR